VLSFRQKITRSLYPLIMLIKGFHNEKGKSIFNSNHKKPVTSFFELKATDISGKETPMSWYKGKKIIVVNVASRCGYTGQYSELEKLYEDNKEELIVLGFPSNDFNQEKGSDKEISEFCRLDYGVTFPLFKKQSVVRPSAQPIYQWLSDKKKNGWNDQAPVWNFSKYLIDEEGTLLAFYGPAVSPFKVFVSIKK
jgi:glutathione peroxidase